MKDLRAVTRKVLKQVEDLSGKGIEFMREDDLPVLTTMQTARHGAPYHVVRYRSSNEPLDYFIVYQAGFLVRLFQCPDAERFDFVPGNDAGRRMEGVIRAAQTVSAEDELTLERFADFTAQWALMKLRSLPIGMRIDRWIALVMPELKELQRTGIALQQQQNADVLSRKIGGLSVPPRLLPMNAAYALFADRLFGNERFEIPYVAAGLSGPGAELLRTWDEAPSDPGHDRALVDRWAAQLGLDGWYRWIPFEP
jgi:hypothetical protein